MNKENNMEYIFNDCGICTNPDKIFLLCENKEHPYRGNYAVMYYAQLPDGTFKAGKQWWFFEGGGATGVSNKYGTTYQTLNEAIIAAGEYFIRQAQKATYSHNEQGNQVKTNTQKLINAIRQNIENYTQPTLF